MKVSFVILHYNAVTDTIKCVESIIKLRRGEQEDVSIIIVDNCSPNGTGQLLKNKYKNTERIDVLLLDKNLGFARGNNAGFIYARKKYNPDFIILSNNDIIIEQENFLSEIVKLYRVHHFAVLGPSIYAPYKGIYQNPLREKAYTSKEIKALITNYQKKIILFEIIEKLHCYPILHNLKRMLKKKQRQKTISNSTSQERTQIVLHGAFLIMSREYISAYPNGLCDKTFMYMEEDILYYMCKEKKLKMLYSPELQVIHNEGASTQNALKSRVRKSIFEFKNTIKSAYILLEILDADNS